MNKRRWRILLVLALIFISITGCNSEVEESSQEIEIRGAIPRLRTDGILIGSKQELDNEKFTGVGELRYLDSKIYEGNFVDGVKEGIGKVFSEDGTLIYEGDWEQNNMSGDGKLYYDDGSYFSGVFKNSNPWDGEYVYLENGNETYRELKEGQYYVPDLSSDNDLKNKIQSVIGGAFGAFGITERVNYTESNIIEEFIQYIISDRYYQYLYEENHDLGYAVKLKVPVEIVDEYTQGYFGMKINHENHKAFKNYIENVCRARYENKYYYIEAPGPYQGSGDGDHIVTSIYNIGANNFFVSVEEYALFEDARIILLELERVDDRYIIKSSKRVNQGYKVSNKATFDKKVTLKNQVNYPEFILEKSNRSSTLKNIKDVYSKIDEEDKKNNKVLKLISDDVDLFIENIFSNSIDIKTKNISLSSGLLGNYVNLIGEIDLYSNDIFDAFKKAGINLERKPSRNITFNLNEYANQNDLNFYIGKDIEEYLINLDKVIFNISGLKVTFDSKTLAEQLESGDFIIELINSDGVYNIAFKDKNGNIKDSVLSKVSISLPLEGEYNNKSVYYTSNKNSVEDNIGGQYDSISKTIEVDVKTTGKLKIKDITNTSFTDIEKQSEETKKAITNLVSKGIMEATNDSEFSPDQIMTREEFTMAIVKTFYELDRSNKTSFTDVSEGDKYYPYIASSEKEDIVRGYPDKTFRGQDPITKEDVMSICARGLHEKKKYIYPENPDQVLKFKDKNKILNYAQKEVALSAREGLIENTKRDFKPQSAMTRAEVAVIINRLIEKLY